MPFAHRNIPRRVPAKPRYHIKVDETFLDPEKEFAMRSITCSLLAALALACSVPAAAQLQVGAGDTVESVLRAQKDKRVTLRLRSGQEMTGTLKASNARVAHLAAVAGREFFDAVVPLEAIDAVLIRTKE
jgi:hypothetical protein